MANCETFKILKRTGRYHGRGCPFVNACNGLPCQLPEAQEAVATLTPPVETAEDYQQSQAAVEALLNYLKAAWQEISNQLN